MFQCQSFQCHDFYWTLVRKVADSCLTSRARCHAKSARKIRFFQWCWTPLAKCEGSTPCRSSGFVIYAACLFSITSITVHLKNKLFQTFFALLLLHVPVPCPMHSLLSPFPFPSLHIHAGGYIMMKFSNQLSDSLPYGRILPWLMTNMTAGFPNVILQDLTDCLLTIF